MTSPNKFQYCKVDTSGAKANNEPCIRNNREDTDEEEREIEVLLQKTNFPFARNFHSKSAHANLSQIADKREESNQQEEEDSDEEFFVHQALLSLRKSKTSDFAVASSSLADRKFEPLDEMKKSFKSSISTLQDNIAPTREEEERSNTDIANKFDCSSSYSSGGSSECTATGQGCWSAPPVFSDQNSSTSNSSSRSDSPDDLMGNKNSQLKRSLFFLEEGLRVEKGGLDIPVEGDFVDSQEQRKRTGTSWSSPSRLFAKGKTRRRRLSDAIGKDRKPEKIVNQDLNLIDGELAVGDNLETKKEAVNSKKEERCEKLELEEEMMSTSSEDTGSDGKLSSSSENEATMEQAIGIPQSSSFKSSSRKIFIAPEYTGHKKTHHYTSYNKFPSSMSDSQLIWYHAPVKKRLSRPRTPKFNESLNSFDEEDTDKQDINLRQLPHSATYCLGSGVLPTYQREQSAPTSEDVQWAKLSKETAPSHRFSMPLPFKEPAEKLFEEEKLCCSHEEYLGFEQPGYSMAAHKWKVKWKKYVEKKNESPSPWSQINYRHSVGNGISMKKKKSSFALDEVVGASIPMADDLTAFSNTSSLEYPQAYCQSSCSSSASQYDNNYYSDPTAEDSCTADKLSKKRYIVRRSPPLACADDLLSDSEISELEKKVARGDFSSPTAYAQLNGEADNLIQAPRKDCRGANFGENSDLCHLTTGANISGSASMPCFSSTAIQTEQLLNTWLDCEPEEQKRHTKHSTVMLRSATMTSRNFDIQQNALKSLWLPQQRRILPLTPDEVVREKQQIASSQPQQSATEQQAKIKQVRRLPQIPLQPFATTHFTSEVGDSLSELPIPAIIQTLSPIKTNTNLQRPRIMTTLQEDLTIGQALPPEPKESTVETPILVSSSTLAKLLPQPVHSSHNYRPDKREYQLSYGVESLLSSAAAEHSRATNKYGIMEDSYYEDGLNGNNQVEEREMHRHLNEENRKNSGYNLAEENSSGISSCCTSSSTNADHPTNRGVAGIAGTAEAPKQGNGPTHRVQFAFSPRHPEEIALEVGDAVKVDRECEDHWCYGTNLRTTLYGIFPIAHVCEIDLVEEICQSILQANIQVPLKQDRDTFYLTMLASVEVGHHKGNDVLMQAINKVCSMYQQKDEILIPQTVLMEVSFRGIHVIDKRKKDFFRCPTFDFFFSLQNISFCGAHPKQLRYFGFITKHPLLPRFACHVFLSHESTQSIVEAIGRAFKRSYDEYMAFAHPTEDIFIE